MLKGKKVVLGVSGGIACYKACEIVSALKKMNCEVDVIMTKHAKEFVSPLTFETLSARPVVSDMFVREREWEVEHIALAKKADVFVVAPATANVIAKIAGGIADDMLTTTILAAKCTKIICPAMNTNMYDSDENQNNLAILKSRGFIIIEGVSGRLACGDIGKGKLAPVEDIVNEIKSVLLPKQDLKGKTFLITAGGTRESIDGVRYITNRSSGKMGLAIADEVVKRGGNVILIAGSVSVTIPDYFSKVIRVDSTQDMYEAVMANMARADVILKAAAPSDYRVKNSFDNKIKGETLTLELVKNKDIAKAVGEIKGDKKLIIFCAETQNLVESAREKLKSKNADMVIANDVTMQGAGFDVDTNIVTLITNKIEINLPKLKKSEVAKHIIDEAIKL